MNVLLLMPASENPDRVYEHELRARFPQLTLNTVEHHDQVAPHIESTEILLTFSAFVADHVIRDAKNLRWIQVLGSGVDGVADSPALRKDVLITSGRGVQAIPVSEAALSMMLMLSRDTPRMVRNQASKHWERWPAQLLHGHTLGILGIGQIAEALAIKSRVLGMRVVGISSSVRTVEGFDRIYARDQLLDAVCELDYLVLLTPYDEATHHIVNESVLKRMKSSACLINLARGGVVNEADLIQALRNNVIRGAALDVFEHEPLSPDSELWSLPNVIVSPHLAGLNASYPHHILPLLERNIARFLAGRIDEMENVVRA